MSIRMSTSQLYSRSLNAMLDVQRAANRTQEQIATNKRVLTPADDPVAATRILQLNQELAGLKQYNNSLSTLNNRLMRTDSALSGVSSLIQKAQELVTQAGNPTINREQRGYLAVDLQSVIDAMAQLMNTRDAGGEYLFAGHQGNTQPFVKGVDGRYQYQGDEGQRFIQVGPVTSIAANDSGYEVFMNVRGAEPGVMLSAGVNNTAQPPAHISGGVVRDAAAFAQFHPDTAVIEFRPTSEVTPAAMNFTVRQASDGRVLAQNVPYVPGQEIEFGGLVVSIDGQPAVGDSYRVESTHRTGLLQGLENFVAQLQQAPDTPQGREQLTLALEHTLTNLGQAQNQMLKTQGAIGARLGQVEANLQSNEDFELTVRATLSELADLDYAEAISRLTQESFVLEAAQMSFSKIARLSLFNYM